MISDRLTSTFEQTELRNRTAKVLETGFRISVAVIAVGLILSVIRQDDLPTTLDQPADIVRGIIDGDPGSILGLGIVSIILTPFVSTVVVATTFLKQGNRRYAEFSFLVLFILLISIGLSLI